jgi:DNA-binding response OmpR family regulator
MAAALRILVVDDEADLRELLKRSFAREGHEVVAVPDGREALEHASGDGFDVVLLDVALGPGPSGYDVARELRSQRNVVPIIMLTALDSEADAVQGLEAGADDYVTKPFGLAELRSRIRAVMRRAGGRVLDDGSMVTVGPVSLDRRKREVSVRGEPVRLTYVEFEVLSVLARQPGHVFSRRMLLEQIWGDAAYRDPRTIDVHIRHLREKLERNPREPEYLLTDRGFGYHFADR